MAHIQCFGLLIYVSLMVLTSSNYLTATPISEELLQEDCPKLKTKNDLENEATLILQGNKNIQEITSLISCLSSDDQLETVIFAIGNSSYSLSDKIAIVKPLKQFPKLIRLRDRFPKLLQNLVWGEVCYIHYTQRENALFGGDRFLSPNIRMATFEESSAQEAQWILESDEQTNGTFKLRNSKYDNMYLSSSLPFALGYYVAVSNASLPLYLTWRFEEAPNDLVYLVNTFTRCYLSQVSDIGGSYAFLFPDTDFSLLRLTCDNL